MASAEVTIIDYGVGNLLSVKRGLEFCGAKVSISSNPAEILDSKRVVLPGVGAFPNAMAALNRLDLIHTIQKYADSGKPLLAICLGMQLLMDESDEFDVTSGLGLIPGRVVEVPKITTEGAAQKIPHIGWSGLQQPGLSSGWSNSILKGIKVGAATYFVHSFMAQPTDSNHTVATALYGGQKIAAVIAKDNVVGCQFHPEKSGEFGLTILENFTLQ
jgi:glutamine amidotransferase